MAPIKNIFSPPKIKPPEPPKIPTQANSAADMAREAETEKQRLRGQRGRMQTRLSGTGILGDDSEKEEGRVKTVGSGLATKTLLGA